LHNRRTLRWFITIGGVGEFYSGIFTTLPLLTSTAAGWLKTELKLSFQFHHVQMDGEQACRFLENLQECMNR
jgi:chloramphenicol O-acetyltransferase type A